MRAQLATLATSSSVRSPIRVQRQAATGPAPDTLRGHPARAGRDEHAAIQAAAARGIATPWSVLPHATLIQRRFGHHDISSIRAHTGSVAATSANEMRARAFAAGDHVVLDRSADLRTVAHEAAHVVQQRGGVRLQGGVGAAGDVHERHADQVAAAVIQGRSAEALLDRYAGAVQTDAPAAGCIQRWHDPETGLGSETEDEDEDQDRDQADASAQLAHAVAFERKLGKAAYRDPRSLGAADQMITSMTQAILPDFDEADAEQREKLVDLYGRDAVAGAGSAGQVGNEFAVVMEALLEGNLRERMTGLYNASLSGFKTEVLRLMQDESWAEMKERGLDDEKLKRRDKQMKYNPGAKDLYRDPGNPIDRKHLSTFKRRGETRTKAPDDEQYSQRTVGDLEREGMELSPREKRFMYPDPDAVDPGEPVKWKEGGTYWQINPDNKWVKKCRDKLRMPVTAGPSGTALRMFQVWEFVGKPTPAAHFRLALLGWMMTSNDHSFHEIMLTSAEYGLRYKPGLDAYRHVEPFTAKELRAIADPEGFPDEQ